MLESLRYRWTSKDVKGIALAAAVLAALAAFGLWRSLSPGALVKGVVVSTGAASTGRACGGTRQLASVQLSDGRVVYALVDSGTPLRPGTLVSLQKPPWPSCGIEGYEVVAFQ